MTGPNALDPMQTKSTLFCTFLTIILLVLFAVGLLVSMGQGAALISVVAILLVLLAIPFLYSSFRLWSAMKGEDNNTEESDSDEANSMREWSLYTVSKPKEWYCWIRLALDFAILFLFPMIYKYASSFPKSATFFLFCSVISGSRVNLDAISIVREHTTLSNIELGTDPKLDTNEIIPERKEVKDMIIRARASEIMGKVTSNSRTWLWTIGFVVIAILYLAKVGDLSQDDPDTATDPNAGRPAIAVVEDFYYPPQSDISYPTCQLNKGYAIPGKYGNSTRMTDYNLLAALAYEIPSVTDYVIEHWFQEQNFFVDEAALVSQWKMDSGNEDTGASFKLFSMPSQPGFGIVSIRGTETKRDSLLNMQLYMSSMLTQVINLLIPYSWIFQPIFDEIIAITSWIGTDEVKSGLYYSTITDFVNDLTRNNYSFEGKSFDTLRLTGVSLGGGLAMISAGQTDAFSVTFAGPSPTLGRKTFSPPLDMKDINEKMLNVVVENDFTSHIGGTARNAQHIECRHWPNATYKKCHSFWKQLCEFTYSCGSGGRPVICFCTEDHGFPEPLPKGNRTYSEACSQAAAAVPRFMM